MTQRTERTERSEQEVVHYRKNNNKNHSKKLEDRVSFFDKSDKNILLVQIVPTIVFFLSSIQVPVDTK